MKRIAEAVELISINLIVMSLILLIIISLNFALGDFINLEEYLVVLLNYSILTLIVSAITGIISNKIIKYYEKFDIN